jgi:quinol monooxygenase YgiN
MATMGWGALGVTESGRLAESELHPGRTGVVWRRMNYPENVVSINPYMRAKPGQLPALQALFPAFVARTAKEPLCLFYEFTVNGDVTFCREAYLGAEGVQAHLANVGDLITEQLKYGDLFRLELHGPAAELDKLRAGLASMNVEWYIKEAGVRK